MSVTKEHVAAYLASIHSLKAINNHHVRDEKGKKVEQTPSTIALGLCWIEEILDEASERRIHLSNPQIAKLENLYDALDAVPINIGANAIYAAFNGLEDIQSNLMDAVEDYLDDTELAKSHLHLLKALVLVLKILHYDLSKKTGPITYGYGFFSIEILSNDKRLENLETIAQLLEKTIHKFEPAFHENSPALAC